MLGPPLASGWSAAGSEAGSDLLATKLLVLGGPGCSRASAADLSGRQSRVRKRNRAIQLDEASFGMTNPVAAGSPIQRPCSLVLQLQITVASYVACKTASYCCRINSASVRSTVRVFSANESNC
jgi:hypothetical protein